MHEARTPDCPQQHRYYGRSVSAATCGLAIILLGNVIALPIGSADSIVDRDFQSQLPRLQASSSFRQNWFGERRDLTYKPAPCLISSPAGKKISPRAHQLRCSIQRSVSRAEYLSREVRITSSSLATSNDFGLEARNGPIPSNQQLATRSLESDVWYQGEYLMSFEIGTPARVFTGIIDTGSDLTWIRCRPCFECSWQTHTIFRPWQSSTYKHVYCANKTCDYIPVYFCSPHNDHCFYRYRYGDASYAFGSLSSDILTLNSTSGSQVQFPGFLYGCSHASHGYFTITGADGIIGLGQGPLSLASQIGAVLGSNIFSYCLVSQGALSDYVTSPFYFGKAAIPSNSTGLSYTRIITNQRRPALYYVEFRGISVENRRLKIAPDVFALQPGSGRGGTIIDSGTTVTNLEKRAFHDLQRAFTSTVPYNTTRSDSGFALCFDVRGHNKHGGLRFPSLTFHLQGVDLDLPMDNYIVEAEDDTLCLAIHPSREHNLSIVGNIQQRNYQIIYDRDNQRIGFIPTVCG